MNPDVLRSLFTLPPREPILVLLAVLTVAAISDIRSRRIPNWLTLSGVVLGFAINIWMGPPRGGALFALKGFVAGFGLYMLLYIVRAMGAADVKLMAAVGAFLGARHWFGMFLVTELVGGLMAIVLVAARGRMRKTLFNVGFILSEMMHGRPAYLRRDELDVRSGKGLGFPRGAVIALGMLCYLVIAARLNP